MKTIKVTKTIEVEENRATVADFLNFLADNNRLEVVAKYSAEYALQRDLFLKHPVFGYYSPIEAMLRADSTDRAYNAVEDLFVWNETTEGLNYWSTFAASWRQWLNDHKINPGTPFYFE